MVVTSGSFQDEKNIELCDKVRILLKYLPPPVQSITIVPIALYSQFRFCIYILR